MDKETVLEIFLDLLTGIGIGFMITAAYFFVLNLAALSTTGYENLPVAHILYAIILGISSGYLAYNIEGATRAGTAIGIVLTIYIYNYITTNIWTKLLVGPFDTYLFLKAFLFGVLVFLIFKAYQEIKNARSAKNPS